MSLRGVVHGRTIELEDDPHLPDGTPVEVELRTPIPPVRVAVLDLAHEVSMVVKKIIHNEVKPFDPEIQRWATEKFVWLNDHKAGFPTQEDELIEAIEDCLVDILSCDNASWDTPIWGFEQNLEKLDSLLRQTNFYNNT